MTNQEEEILLLDKLLDARHAVEVAKVKVAEARVAQTKAEGALQVMEQAVADYMTGNGLLKFEAMNHTVSLGSSYSVDIVDSAAIPEEYIREKVVREPNKQLIAAQRPQANWYTVRESNKITVRGK